MRNETKIMKILPVDLLLEKRPCLVVGGGPISARKVGHLLDAGAKVTIVSSEVCNDIVAWKKAGRVRSRAHDFKESDIKGQRVVFAATNNPAVNGRIVALCHRKGVLCCSVDDNWTRGDFVTPATSRRPAVTLTVSTGGQSCRRARLVKDYLARHIDTVMSADLLALSGGKSSKELGAMIHQVWGIHEFVILTTKSTTEVFAVVSRDPMVEKSLKVMVGGKAKRGLAALKYMVKRCHAPSENVAEELKKSLKKSQESGWAGVLMREWIGSALHLAGSRRLGGTPRPTSKSLNLSGRAKPPAEPETVVPPAKAHAREVAGDYEHKYELIIRGFQGRNPVE